MRTIVDRDDFQLLRHFVETNSQEAFRQLVDVHMNLVYSVCLRETRDPMLAQDVTQAVFLTLFRKASTIRKGTVLAGWLFNTSRFAAKNARRQELRRQALEQELMEAMAQSTRYGDTQYSDAEGETWQSIEPLLHEAIVSLGAKEREAILLRFFQDKSLKEVGLELNTTENAAQMRVSRAVEKLKRYLQKQGVVVPVALLSALLSEHAVQAAPASCAQAVGHLLFGAGAAAGSATATSAALTTPHAYSISQGVMKSMFLAKWKAASMVAVLGVTGVVGSQYVSNWLPLRTTNTSLVGKWQAIPQDYQGIEFLADGTATSTTVLRNKVLTRPGTYRIVDDTHLIITPKNLSGAQPRDTLNEYRISGNYLALKYPSGLTGEFEKIGNSQNLRASLPSGTPILDKSKAAYAALSTYVGQTTVRHDIHDSRKQTYNATANIEFRRPDLLHIDGLMTNGGTYQITYDGQKTKVQMVNNGTPRVSTHASLQVAVGSMTGVAADAPVLIPAVLMNFAWGNPFWDTKKAKLEAQESIDGAPCYKVTIQVPHRKRAFWVDTKTFLFRRYSEEQDQKDVPLNTRPPGNTLLEDMETEEAYSSTQVHDFTIRSAS